MKDVPRLASSPGGAVDTPEAFWPMHAPPILGVRNADYRTTGSSLPICPMIQRGSDSTCRS